MARKQKTKRGIAKDIHALAEHICNASKYYPEKFTREDLVNAYIFVSTAKEILTRKQKQAK